MPDRLKLGVVSHHEIEDLFLKNRWLREHLGTHAEAAASARLFRALRNTLLAVGMLTRRYLYMRVSTAGGFDEAHVMATTAFADAGILEWLVRVALNRSTLDLVPDVQHGSCCQRLLFIARVSPDDPGNGVNTKPKSVASSARGINEWGP